MTTPHAVVVGSGIAGLVTALHAVDHGCRVTLVTKDVLEHANTRYAQGGIAGVMFDPSRACAWRRLGLPPSPLVVENDLPALREGRERRPKQVMVEQQTAIDADNRRGAGHFRGEVHGELEPTRLHDAPSEARRTRTRASKCYETFSGADRREGNRRHKIVTCITFATVLVECDFGTKQLIITPV